MTDADAIIRALGLEPHPEGGFYAETWRDPAPAGQRVQELGRSQVRAPVTEERVQLTGR